MKNKLKLAMLCTMLIGASITKAQNSLSLNLFDNYSNTINCPISELDKIFNLNQGNAVTLSLSANTNLTGTIGTSVQRYANLKSVVIKLNGLQGAIFNISKRTNADNTITYVGRIINERFADGYELIKDATGYLLTKIKTDDVMQDHN